MLIKTKYFGDIDLEESKIITLENGLMGYEEYKQFTILYDIEDEGVPIISWLQSIEEPGLALPVMPPTHIKENYNPIVDDDLLTPLGELTEDNLILLLTVTVPAEPKDATANLKAPIIINSDTRKGCQLISENPEYIIKYKIYDAIQKWKAEKGEK